MKKFSRIFLIVTISLVMTLSLTSCSFLEPVEDTPYYKPMEEAISNWLEKAEKEVEPIVSAIEENVSSTISSTVSSTKDFLFPSEDDKQKEVVTDDKKENVSENLPGTSGTLSIQFIDVGQADAALVECGGEYLLIDGGNRGDSDILYAILKRKGVNRLDYVVGTHAHEDHIGGIPGALEACESVGVVYSPVTEYDSKTFLNFKAAAHEKAGGLTVPKSGDTFTLGDAVVEILGPVKEYKETNDTSIVVKITFGENSFLFAGDIEYEAEIDLVESGVDLSADVLKVPHHGGSTSTCYRFLREVMPKYGIISVGEGNSYGHPHDEPLSRLRDADVHVYRTDEVGDVICTSDGKNITFETIHY